MINKKIRKTGAALFLAAVLLLAGCKEGIPMGSGVRETAGYSQAEAMIFVATEKNRYEAVYTKEIWGKSLDEDGTTVESHLISQIKSFLQDVKTLNLLAGQREITLSSGEEDQVRKMAEEFYASLSEGDKAYMKSTVEDIESMYGEYCLADKVVKELTKDVDLEISDSEAKVITILQMRLEDEAEAGSVYEEVMKEGSDFKALAKKYSKDEKIEYQIGRGEVAGEVGTAPFDLAKDQVSVIINQGDSYYIQKCVSDYDEDATLKRKEQMASERRNQAFSQVYDAFKTENYAVFSDDMWEKIVISGDDQSTTTNFFDIYKKYFSGS